MKIRNLISVICAAAVMTSIGTAAVYADSEVPAASTAAVQTANTALVISGDELRTAYEAAGTNTTAYTTFKELGSYELQFNYRLGSGITKTYTALSPMMKGITAYIPIQDMLDKLHITAEDVADITINGPSLDNVAKISFSLTSSTPVTTTASTTAAYTDGNASAGDRNPSTGAADIAVPLVLAGMFGAAAAGAATVKLHKKN